MPASLGGLLFLFFNVEVMNKVILLLAMVILLASCGAFDPDYKFYFYNHSSRDISIIIDLNARDQIISYGSWVEKIGASTYSSVNAYKPWDKVVKDSMHIYVIDVEQILLPNDYLSKDLIEKIEPEMILTRMTVTHRDFDNKRVDYWP